MSELDDDEVIRTAHAMAYRLETDSTPVDRDWLNSIGDEWTKGPWQYGGVYVTFNDQQAVACGVITDGTRGECAYLFSNPTRGQVRTLLRLMKDAP